MKKIEWKTDQAPFCCGLCEVGHIGYQGGVEWWRPPKSADTPDQALGKIRGDEPRVPLMFNFTHEVPKEFRDYVQSQKDWKLIHKWKNPNTGNIITCGILINGSNQRWKKDNG